ncbi:MAG: YihY/virulence factor BrkB family protein, partial [Acetobacteraceae bacterium]
MPQSDTDATARTQLDALASRLGRLSPGTAGGGRQTPADDAKRDKEASGPVQVPPAGWKDVLRRTYRGVNDKNLFLIAGGVTYSVVLALFPALLALVSLYGLAFDRSQVEKQVDAMAGVMPESARQLIATELHQIVGASGGALGFTAILGILFALWAASRGMSGMMSALDIAYGETETRGFVRFNAVALVMTLALVAGGILAILLVAGIPAVVVGLGKGAGGILKWVALIAEWPILMVVIMTLLALLYRFAPDRHTPKWRWVSPGAIVGTALWVLGSVGFAAYVANFANYNATYGALGAVVVLLTWLYLSAFVVLLGAQINAEVERKMTAF